MKRVIRAGLIFVGILTCGIVFLFWLTWRQVRQERLNQALIAAVGGNDARTATDLLNEGADANATEEESPQKISLWHRLMQTIQGKPAQPDIQLTALMIAVFLPTESNTHEENLPLIGALLDHGANAYQHAAGVNPTDKVGETAFDIAIKREENATVHLLLTRGRKPDFRQRQFLVDLLVVAASQEENEDTNNSRSTLEIIADLLALGVDVNQRDQNGVTALFAAIGAIREDVVRFLLTQGADVTLTSSGATPLAFTRELLQQEPKAKPIIELLKQAGAKK